MDGGADPLVGPAPAQVVRDSASSICASVGRGVVSQQRGGGHDLARLAVSALGYVLRDPGLLHGMPAVGRQPLDGGDALARAAPTVMHAGRGRRAVEVDRARAALPAPHPYLVPVRPSPSRSAQSSGVSAGSETRRRDAVDV